MLVVSLSRITLLLSVILILITFLIDNGNCDQDEHSRTYIKHYYPPEFRASHSPPYDYISIPGDIILGGFFPIHQPPSNEYGSNQCAVIKRERGVQRLEAMLFALDVVNNRSSYLMSSILKKYNIRFGALIYDSCDYESYAVERALNMLLPSLDHCMPLQKQKQNQSSSSSFVAGVIGSASSTVSMAIADILRLAEIPQISYASTSTDLSQKPRFQYFSRVVPPDTYQAEAVVSIIQFLNWTYVAVIKETGSYGERLTDDFKAKLKNKTICIAGELSVNIKDLNSYARVIKELYDDEKYRFVVGVVVFAQEDSVRQILNQTSSRDQFKGRWIFLGTDGWGKKRYPVTIESFGRAAINAITIAPKLYLIPEFDDYFTNLTPSKNTRNPWFKEYWEETYKCKFTETPDTIFNRNFTRTCTDFDHINTTLSVSYFQEGYVHYVVDAVFTLVTAIQRLIEEKCLDPSVYKPLCREFFPFDGTKLLTVLRNTTFRNELSKRIIKFTTDGDGIGTYDIFQYQIINSSDRLDYVTIGEFTDSDQSHERLRINLQSVKWVKYNREITHWSETSQVPRSFCSESCPPGEIRTNIDSQQCCWTCRTCELFHITINETACSPCSEKEVPNSDFTKCIAVAGEYLSAHNIIAWPALILSSIGLLMAIYTIVIFIRFAQTPVIKASSRELSYFLLSGICCCHLCAWPLILKPHVLTCLFIRIGVGLSLTICLAALLTKTNRIYTIVIFIRFAQTPVIKASSRELSYFLLSGICCCHLCAWPLILKPHVLTCLFIRIGVGLSLTICLAALLTKTNRLARIFNNSQRLTQPSCLSPRSQLGICGGIVSIQLIGVLLWIIISPPATKLKSELKHNQKRLILVCQTDNEYIACSLVYNMILGISCTLYAIKTRHIPENFNEAKHIGFAMYSVCIIWLAFIAIFFGLRTSENWFRIQLVTLAICLSLSATVILLCLFAPKLYIVLFNPSKNIHVKFKTTLTTPQQSVERPSTSNNQDESIGTANNRRRRHASSDYATDVTLFNSKTDSWALNINDETTQTGSISGGSSLFNGACTDAERQKHQLTPTQDDETTDLLPTSKQQTNSLNPPNFPIRPASSNLVIATENPWKKLSNVRYKLDAHDPNQRTANNRRRRHASSDYATDVTLFNSKTDSWALNINDETTQTGSISGGSSLFNGACTDAERQKHQLTSTQDDETTDLLSTSKQQTNSLNPPNFPLKPASSNLVIATENPWKKLSNVRYKLDSHDPNQSNSTKYNHVHAQHITFV
ncbi:unnamed protein product [Adineta steineri]|uniref:G-protein coupled receptors family 3 profile domain-containing protein n=1 Tax=Adineta steineri TaxID=433720 RepID=A0A815BWL2_9BILA|nr:unnamed protein product [Adineta steineri]